MKTQKCSPLLSKRELEDVFNDGYLLERKSFHVLEPSTLTYNTKRESGSFLEEASFVRSSYLEGRTIIVKNLEGFNENIRMRSAKLGRSVDVHLYLVPSGGKDSFPFHKDDRDVIIHMVYGEKTFYLKRDDGSIEERHLGAGDELFIPEGQEHMAKPKGASCLLSFGVDTRQYYKIAGGLCEKDLDLCSDHLSRS